MWYFVEIPIAEAHMARVTLQVKNIASMVLATGGSLAWSFASRRFDSPGKNWIPAAVIGTFCLGCQLGLLFVESKEEQELSSFRRQRDLELERASAERLLADAEQEKLSIRIQREIDSGNLELADRWAKYRRKHYGGR